MAKKQVKVPAVRVTTGRVAFEAERDGSYGMYTTPETVAQCDIACQYVPAELADVMLDALMAVDREMKEMIRMGADRASPDRTTVAKVAAAIQIVTTVVCPHCGCSKPQAVKADN